MGQKQATGFVRQGDAPTLLKLKTMKGADGNPLRIIPRIAAGDYMTFGMCLLQDENGDQVELVKRDHRQDGTESVTQAIIQKWLASGAAPTRTYQHLIECLRQSELGALAEDIAISDEDIQTWQACTSAKQDQKKETTTITTSYVSYLKRVYTHLSQSHTSQHWTHLPRCEFVQLAMIKGIELRRGGPEEMMVRLAQQGKIETIMSAKMPTDLESLFLLPLPPLVVLPPPKFHRVMLIEGPPGGGKSTLALHICHKWAQGASFLARFDIVVLAYLRDEAVQNASTLAGILPADIKKVSQMVATQMQACYGQNVLFIFDGWDEFPPQLQKQSLVSTIIQEPHKLGLHQSTVIITTRPVSSGNLLYVADQRVEVLGFTQLQIREYIEKALDGDNTRIQKLVQHLNDHPVIEGYCYIPLHVATLVHIFLTMKGVLPTTLHELFCNLVLCCIVRELETHESNQNVEAELSSLDDLSDDLKSHLSNLSALAYEGVMQDKVIFYKNDLKALHLPTNLPSLGLLQAVEGLTLTSKSRSYNFLHLSVQELLAAYHISQMDPNTQVEVFMKLFGSPRFEAVLHYYCGFTKLKNLAIQGFIYSYSNQQKSFKNFLPLLHCFFEAQQPRLAQLIDHKFTDVIDLKFLSDNPVDYIVVGYFISSLLSSSTSDDESTSMQVKIGDNVDDYRLKLLLSQLSRSSIGRQLLLDMYKPNITGKGVHLLVSHLKQALTAITELSVVDVDGFQRGEDGLLHFVDALQTNCHLTKVKLEYVDLICSRENGSTLTKMLCMNKTLTHLDLSLNRLSDSGALCIFQGLQQNTTLTHLNLQSNGITGCEDTAQALIKLLQVNKTLTHFDLSCNRLSNLTAHCIFQGLQQNTALIHLNLQSNGITGCEDNAQALNYKLFQVNKTLTHLDLCSNGLSDSGAQCIFQGLQQNATLIHLNLQSNGITGCKGTAQALNKLLQANKTLTHLNLSNNKIFSYSTSCCILEGLQHNTTLVHLNLANTGLSATEDTTRALTTMLQVNMSLKHTDLSRNYSFSSGARYIFKILRHNTTLVHLELDLIGMECSHDIQSTFQALNEMLIMNKTLAYLNLSYNGISDSGACCIFQALEHNTALVHLDLHDVDLRISDEVAVCIAEALKSNCSLQILNICSNRIGKEGFDRITRSLETNTTLRELYLIYNCGKPTVNEKVQTIHRIRQKKGLHPVYIGV